MLTVSLIIGGSVIKVVIRVVTWRVRPHGKAQHHGTGVNSNKMRLGQGIDNKKGEAKQVAVVQDEELGGSSQETNIE